jgi:hypothetical protein
MVAPTVHEERKTTNVSFSRVLHNFPAIPKVPKKILNLYTDNEADDAASALRAVEHIPAACCITFPSI